MLPAAGVATRGAKNTIALPSTRNQKCDPPGIELASQISDWQFAGMNRKIAVVVSSVVSAFSVAVASDWPQFRGPDGNGHSTAKDVPLKWGERNNVAWKTAIPGKGWSSPSLSEGRIYLTSAIAKAEDQDAVNVDRSLRALAVDAKTGDIVWDTEIFQQPAAKEPKIHRKNSHASPTVLVKEGKVYVHFGHMGTACLDPDGNILWKTQKLTYRPVHGNGGCPILVNGHLVFSCDGGSDPFIAALKSDTGDVAWKVARDTDARKTFSFSTPSVFEIDGVSQIITPGSNNVSALDPKTGKTLWQCKYDGYSVIPKPLLAHGLLYIGTGYDDATLMAIRPGMSGDVTESNVAWTINKRAPHTPSFLVVGNELYFVADNGIVTCADARTGDIHWQERSGGRGFSASPIYADGRIYLQDEHGLSIVLAPGKEFKILAENKLDGKTLSSCAVTDGALFVRSDTHLYRVGKK